MNKSAFESCTAFLYKIEDLLTEIFTSNNVTYHRIDARIEASKQDGNYLPVIRIVTFFEDSFKKILTLLSAEFDLVNDKPSEKRTGNDNHTDLQLLAGLKANRQQLPEYKRDANRKFRIVICTLLQDVKDGIEKEIGINSGSFPENLKREFHRVGVLLEMADSELTKIRTAVGENKGHIQDEIITSDFFITENIIDQPVTEKTEPGAARIIPITPVAQEINGEKQKTQDITAFQVHAENNGLHPSEAEDDHAAINGALNLVIPEPGVKNIDTMEMNVNDLSSTSININNIENKNGVSDDKILETIAPLAVTPEIKENAPAPQSDAVSLNIDNVETFNMNVTGVVDAPHDKTFEDTIAEITPWEENLIKQTQKIQLDENSPMTDATLREYVSISKAVKEIDSQIAARAGAKLNADVDVEGDVERLRFLKVYSLKQLHEKLSDNKNDIIAFAEKWIGKDNGGTFDSGICLFYLEYLLVGKRNDPAFAVEYVLKFISDNDYSARFIIPTYNSICKSDQPIASHLTLK